MTVSEQMAGSASAIAGCLEACARCRVLVEAVTGSRPEAYRGIGPHLRHCLDHFTCFFRGEPGATVDYDARDRDERLERDPSHFLAALESVESRLRSLETAGVGRALSVRQEAASGGRMRTVSSTVERELMFLSSHTIHHIEIMSQIAARAGVEVPDGLGIAFSTESHMHRDPSVRSR